MELKVGMYVRTKKGIGRVTEYTKHESWGYIVKVLGQYSCYTHTSNGELSDVIKASDNIIGLIYIGDIIETPKGVFQVGYIENNVIYTDDSKVIACLRKDEHLCFENNIIKSIVTKEMFDSVKYEVKYEKI